MILSLVSALLLLTVSVLARVEGPFALYLRSSDPKWNMRYINIGARNAYMAVAPTAVSSPSQIPAANINFFLNTTATLTPDAPYGQLVWGAQSYYSNLFGRIDVLTPSSSALQPIFFDMTYSLQGYSSRWNFTANKQLQLDNVKDHFYAKELRTTMYNYDTVFWLFGSPSQSGLGASKVTVWRYDPPSV
ncbi:SubName: Full=Uncharacterized protein {ECO:0000313/EMBL:CCA76357.1} [Serendipita indica DSM 11827]|uniref:Uncharacterized protein n=1 Tax=Serendipita indica (strain DSM 11827) TaxID=1109443 RepID=G4TYG4_SERID|nr:SubName: Full=Uncharacterized protein {ECO:0000313/EMBL:CCA76357.1} [Serendipita indica DSM 11827]CCA76357.1 hypothetical protein PIIN_10350 [Serendipita indica DSM 11827]